MNYLMLIISMEKSLMLCLERFKTKLWIGQVSNKLACFFNGIKMKTV